MKIITDTIKFTNKAGYDEWIKAWKFQINYQTKLSRILKFKVKEISRSRGGYDESFVTLENVKLYGRELFVALEVAKERMRFIYQMEKQANSEKEPVTVEDVKNLVFHFNKKHLEFPDVVPAWAIKAKGNTYYCKSVICDSHWNTKETPNSSTKGSIVIKRANLHISKDGVAHITTPN